MAENKRGMSKRLFKVLAFEQFTRSEFEFTIDDLIIDCDGSEFNFSMQDIFDDILDLKLGETINVLINRDDPQSKGVLIRTR